MTKEVLKIALEALEPLEFVGKRMDGGNPKIDETITAIKEALAQPEHDYKDLYEKEKRKSAMWLSKYEEVAGPAPKAIPMAQPEQEPVAWISTTELLVMRGNALGGAKDWRVNLGLKPEEGDVGLYTTPPQRTWVGLDWLPEHKCGLHLSHNEHRDVYETIEQFYDSEDFISSEEWHKSVAKDSVWVLHWYPETPIGFIRIAASTLDAIEAKLRSKNESKN